LHSNASHEQILDMDWKCLVGQLNAQEPIPPSVTTFMGKNVEITESKLTSDARNLQDLLSFAWF